MDVNSERKSNFNLMYLAIIILILIVMLYLVMKPSSRIQDDTRINLWNGDGLNRQVTVVYFLIFPDLISNGQRLLNLKISVLNY